MTDCILCEIEFGCFTLGILRDMRKDTVTNKRKFDFDEEMYEEIHKKSHLKET